MSTPQEFIDYLIPLTKDKPVLQSLIIAQCCLESGFGKHIFYNNLLGIKCHKGVNCREAKTKEFVSGSYRTYRLAFAVYDSIADCIADYINILSRPRYQAVLKAKDFWQATDEIRKCGYATSPTYTQNLRNLIIKHKLYELDFKMKPDDLITPNFKFKEFWCKDGTPVPEYLFDNMRLVANELQKIRDYYDKPIRINSAYRTKEYNDSLGSAASPKSMHLLMLAADIKPLWKISISEFYRQVKEITDFKGFGIGLTFLHCDLREKFTVWVY